MKLVSAEVGPFGAANSWQLAAAWILVRGFPRGNERTEIYFARAAQRSLDRMAPRHVGVVPSRRIIPRSYDDVREHRPGWGQCGLR
jgi:hypothetical protein